jgi:hypothetical protein
VTRTRLILSILGILLPTVIAPSLVAAQQPIPAGVTQASRSSLRVPDSSNVTHSRSVIVVGAVAGGIVGYLIGGRAAQRPASCSVCAITGPTLGKDRMIGTMVGAIAGGATAWWLFARE